MIKKSMALLFLSLLVLGTSSQAVLMGYESFNYPDGSLNGQNDPSDGFKFQWYTSTYSVDTNGLSMPNYPLAAEGGAMSGSGGAVRTLTFEGLGLDSVGLIDFSQEQTRYLSVMMKRTPATWIEMRLQNAAKEDVVKFGLASNDKFSARMAGLNAYGGDCSTSNAYFIVLKIVAHSSADDQIFLKGYSGSDTVASEPTSWTVVNSTNLNDVLTRVDFTGKSGYVSMVDEIVVGTTWEDVAGNNTITPEAATIVSLEPYAAGVLEMVVDAPTPSLSYPKGMDDLVAGSWTNVGHSIDGNAPFVVTNLDYSTDSGSNKVIYLEADKAVGFFKIDAVGE